MENSARSKKTGEFRRNLIPDVSLAFIILILLLLSACGGSSSSGGSSISYTTENNHVITIAGHAGEIGSADGIGTAATFYSPSGITTDGTDLYVADYGNHTIRKIVISTGAVTTIAGRAGTDGSADGVGTAATFRYPFGIITDGTDLYVTDNGNSTIRKIVISTGAVTTIAGIAGTNGSADGIGTGATFYSPTGITMDGTDLYLTDTGNHTIRKIVISTGAVTTIAGSAGAKGSADGAGAAATFYSPTGITADGTNLYVADYGNYTIRRIVISTGSVTTIAGSAGVNGQADGTGTAANFYEPTGITTDGTNLYVADSGNNTIRRIVISTLVVQTVAGSLANGSADGTGAAAGFYYPTGITTDGTNLYVADYANDTIRKIY
jgi:DNA-binding beta-propeller fold protein YncE